MEIKPHVYLFRRAQKPDAVTLLLLHGTGGDEVSLIPVGEKFGQEVHLLSVRGNVMEHGMPRFFRRKGPGIFDETDLEMRTRELVAFLRDISVKEGFSLERMVALGYSNGANMAGSILIKYPSFLSGAILFRPMQPYQNMPPVSVEGNIRPLPVFLTTGRQDPTIRETDTERYIQKLTAAGYRITAHLLNAGHELTAGDIDLSLDWFRQNFPSESSS